MEKQIKQVREFREVFNIGANTVPTLVPLEQAHLHHKLLLEEVQEYKEAVDTHDIIEVADAITDIMYLAIGAAIHHGLSDKLEELFTEVQRSNMSKLDANGKPIYRPDGKIMKSSLFSEPDIAKILNNDKS